MARETGKRSQILAAAKRLFAERGMSEVTMDEVAEATPVSKMTIYKYFKAKDGLVDAVLQDICDRAAEIFDKVVSSANSFTDAIRAFSRFNIEDIEGLSSTMIMDLTNNYPEKAQMLMGFYKTRMEPVVEKMIFDAQARGEVRRDISTHVIVLFIQAIKEFFSRPHVLKDVGDMETVTRQAQDILFRGILLK